MFTATFCSLLHNQRAWMRVNQMLTVEFWLAFLKLTQLQLSCTHEPERVLTLNFLFYLCVSTCVCVVCVHAQYLLSTVSFCLRLSVHTSGSAMMGVWPQQQKDSVNVVFSVSASVCTVTHSGLAETALYTKRTWMLMANSDVIKLTFNTNSP